MKPLHLSILAAVLTACIYVPDAAPSLQPGDVTGVVVVARMGGLLETPVRGAKVRVERGSGVVSTGEDGRFVLRGLPASDVVVAVTWVDHGDQERQWTARVPVTIKQQRGTRTWVDVGRIRLAQAGEAVGQVDVGGMGPHPAPWTQVVGVGTGARTQAAQDGTFRLPLPTGTQMVAAAMDARTSAAVAARIKSGLETPVGTLTLGTAIHGRVQGQVMGAQGHGVEELTGMLVPVGEGGVTALGTVPPAFSLDVPPGLWVLVLEADGFLPLRIPGILVGAGEVLDLGAVVMQSPVDGTCLDLDQDGLCAASDADTQCATACRASGSDLDAPCGSGGNLDCDDDSDGQADVDEAAGPVAPSPGALSGPCRCGPMGALPVGGPSCTQDPTRSDMDHDGLCDIWDPFPACALNTFPCVPAAGDAGVPDAHQPDAAAPDAGVSDAAFPDAALPQDAGTPDAAPTVQLMLSGPAFITQGTSKALSLTVTGSGPQGVTWTVAPPAAGGVATSGTFTAAIVLGQATITATSVAFPSVQASWMLEVVAAPDSTITGPIHVSMGDTPSFSVPDVPGASQTWSVTGSALILGSALLPTVMLDTSASGMTTVQCTVTNQALTTSTSQVQVTAWPVPTITSLTASPNPAWEGTNVTITGAFVDGTGTLTGVGAVNPGTLTTLMQVAQDTTLTLTVTNPAGRAVTQTLPVTVTPGAWRASGQVLSQTGFVPVGLPDGRILLVGSADVNIYDPFAETVVPATGSPFTPSHPTLSVLKLQDGRVLIMGGQGVTQVHAFDWKTNQVTAAFVLAQARITTSLAQLPDGSIILAGGQSTGTIYLAPTVSLNPDGTSTTTQPGSLTFPRVGQLSAVLPNGTMMVWAGVKPPPTGVAEPEILENGVWHTASAMPIPCNACTGIILADGRPLVAGGTDSLQAPTSRVATYDTKMDVWTVLSPLSLGRRALTSVQLPDGRVVMAGGGIPGGVPRTDMLLPKTGLVVRAQDLPVAGAPSGITLGPTGQAVVVSGTGLFTLDPRLKSPSVSSVVGQAGGGAGVRALQLRDGRVLITGGEDSSGTLAAITVFNPPDGTLSHLADLNTPRTRHAVAQLPDGRVVLAGGVDALGVTLASVEAVDPVTGTVMALPSLGSPRADALAYVHRDALHVLMGRDALDLLPQEEMWTVGTAAFVAGSTTGQRQSACGARLADGTFTVLGGETATPGFQQQVWFGAGWSTGAGFGGPLLQFGAAEPGCVTSRGGRTLVIGGRGAGGTSSDIQTLFWNGGLFASGTLGSLLTPRQAPAATVLGNGDILVVGGKNGASALATSELIQELGGRFTQVTGPLLRTARWGAQAFTLWDGTVLVVGGLDDAGLPVPDVELIAAP